MKTERCMGAQNRQAESGEKGAAASVIRMCQNVARATEVRIVWEYARNVIVNHWDRHPELLRAHTGKLALHPAKKVLCVLCGGVQARIV